MDHHFKLFRAEHLARLRSIDFVAQGPVGHNVREWAKWVVSYGDAGLGRLFRMEKLPAGKIDRATVFKSVEDRNTSTEECCAIIAAWGSMNRDHGRMAFSALDRWRKVAEDLRDGRLERQEGYERLRSLRPRDLPGIRPAYFTKFIYFLLPGDKRRGFIMDQWTSRSMNLLLSSGPLVKMTRAKKGALVKDSNTSQTYEIFCLAIEALARELSCDPEEAEQRIFSEGRGRGEWRGYLRSKDGLE